MDLWENSQRRYQDLALTDQRESWLRRFEDYMDEVSVVSHVKAFKVNSCNHNCCYSVFDPIFFTLAGLRCPQRKDSRKLQIIPDSLDCLA